MTQEKLQNYANLLVRAGGNVQKGQLVIISCEIDAAEFGRMIQKSAYEAGASEVIITWEDSHSTREKYLSASDDVFDTYPQWMIDRFKEWDDRGAVYLRVLSTDPDFLNGVEPDRIARFTKVASQGTKDHSALLMSRKRRWSLCALPSLGWAKKVFPDLSDDAAIEQLGEYILKAARADGNDPVDAWKTHRASFVSRVQHLNNAQFVAVKFKNALGTDLTVGMPKNHIWTGGGSTGGDGIAFFPNIPTEEIFAAPDRNRVEGRVVASLPLSYQGNLIEGIDITFKAGEVVDFTAKTAKDVLTNLIGTDEGSKRLGEVALVPKSSPINQMGTLFYNTLFDENASCHLAIGKAYPTNLQGGVDMTTEELLANGINTSLVHVDFMFGTDDMVVTGITADGQEQVIMENGEFVI